MSEPFLSELKCVSFNFAPKGWAMCNGQLLPINQNQALFSLLGTTYGGDGRVNFGLPNLQGRAPLHMGQGHTLGEVGEQYNHTVTISELPTHVHALQEVNVRRQFGDGDRVVILSAYLAQGMALAHVQRGAALQVRQAEVDAAVSAIGGAEQREERLILIDWQELAIAHRPALRRKVEGHTFQFREEWFRHDRFSLITLRLARE